MKIPSRERVVIAFDIYTDGTIGNFTVVNDTLGYGLSEAAIEGIKTLNDVGFCPSMSNCHPYVYRFYLPVTFRLF